MVEQRPCKSRVAGSIPGQGLQIIEHILHPCSGCPDKNMEDDEYLCRWLDVHGGEITWAESEAMPLCCARADSPATACYHPMSEVNPLANRRSTGLRSVSI